MISIEEKRKIWLGMFENQKDLMEGRVKRDIEKYRKGDCRLKVLDEQGEPICGQKIRVQQKNHDFKFGTHLFLIDQFDTEEKNQYYRTIFKDYFNLATIPFYWKELEPVEGKPRFAKDSENIYRRPAPELCMEYCEQNQIDAKLHCLVYDQFIPNWVPKEDLEAMETLYEKRIQEIAERFAGRMYEFEVTNETLVSANWLTKTAVSGKRNLIEWAFGLADKYLPNEVLVINEAQPSEPVARLGYRSPYFMQIEKCLGNGAPIKKIGLQHHIFTGINAQTEEAYDECIRRDVVQANPQMLLKALDYLAEFGLPLEMTEITIPTFGDTEEDEELQAEILRNMYSVWFSHPAMENIVYWNSVEGYCYKGSDAWDENRCRGALFHQDLTPKKAALMLRKLITEEWHTEMELVTDEDGYADFRGFYGDYSVEVEGKALEFGIHKNAENEVTLTC